MSKASAVRTNQPSRVRLVVFEAELSNGNVNEITQVIQNALRVNNPQTVAPRAIAQRMAERMDATQQVDPETVEEINEVSEPIVEHATQLQSRPTAPRKFRTPKVLDIDLKSGVSFVSFAEKKNPQSDQLKFLIVAAWFKEHRKDIEAITVDHVYTCYRAANWSTAIGDFSSPLRNLKHAQFLEKAGRGAYVINHLGLDKVDKMGT